MLASNCGWMSTAAYPHFCSVPDTSQAAAGPGYPRATWQENAGRWRACLWGGSGGGKGQPGGGSRRARGEQGSGSPYEEKGQNQPVRAEEDSASPVVAEKPIAQHEPSPLIPFDVIGPFEKPAFPSRPGS